MHYPVGWTWNYSYGTTELSPYWQTSGEVKTSGSWETDVIYGLAAFPPQFVGATGCDDPGGDGNAGHPDEECDQFYVYFDLPEIDGYANVFGVPHDTARWTVACHETGHTVGLLHPQDSEPSRAGSQSDYKCMRTDQGSSSFWQQNWLGGENAGELNWWYARW